MKKSILFLAVALVVISISMSSYSKTEEPVVLCDDLYTLELDLIMRMTQKYQETQLELINTELDSVHPKGDSKAAWLSLRVLKDFICQIENYSPAGTIIDDVGVRIYYSAYPTVDEWNDYPDLAKIKKSYAERHTLVLIPTIRNNDYSPANSEPWALMIGDEGRRPARNHGSLFPPGLETGMDY